MGLLDDAIREHLDLKRRRGADPTEVERAEREALGPVRRDPFEQAEDEPQAEFDAGEPGAYDQAAEEGYVEHEPADVASPVQEEPFAEEEPFAGDEPFAEHEPFAEEEPFAEDEPFAEERPAPPSYQQAVGAAGEETAEYDVEGTFGAERPPAPEPHRAPEPPIHDEPAEGEEPAHGDEDVLEETPEFLQDAPEHDRLWFEQRPPKDFDFDG
jgi:hypothetical protein